MTPQQFAMRLRTIRRRRKVTQQALADRVGVSRGYLSRLEMGRHDPPLSLLRKLAKALSAKVSDLVD